MIGIDKRFPGVVALDAVDFDLYSGEVHVLLGENGAGKSTLMKILSGAYRKDAGEVRLEGRAVEIGSPKWARDQGISTIYQEFNLIPQLAVAENIFLGRERSKFPGIIDRRRAIREAQEILDDLGVDISAKSRVADLTVAEQQMVEIAKALSLKAQIVIMDEPTSALTDRETEELFTKTNRLKDRGVGVIYISHRMEELFQIGGRVTVLRDGRKVATHQLSEVTPEELVRLMANRDLKEHFPRVRTKRGKELLSVRNLSRKGQLDKVSFFLRSGEVLGVAGLLGAGRTALARAIFGVNSFDEGEIWVRGKPVSISSPAVAIRHGIGYLTEDRKKQGLVLKLSVKHNISLPSMKSVAKKGFLNRQMEKKLADRYISDLEIKTPSADVKSVFLSGGNQQKVVLSKWLARESEILIFDEPTRGIDVGAKVEIYQLMNRLTANGAGILMISSELPEILGMSDRVLVMRAGRIVEEFEAGDATQERILGAALGQTPGKSEDSSVNGSLSS
jgi:ribose transport system ATP-binding protein